MMFFLVSISCGYPSNSRMRAFSSVAVPIVFTLLVIRWPLSCSTLVLFRLSVLFIMCVFSPILKVSSTLPSFEPFRRIAVPVSSARDNPNKANSIARSIVLFPEPMSPESKTIPVGKSTLALVYERMFCRVMDTNCIVHPLTKAPLCVLIRFVVVLCAKALKTPFIHSVLWQIRWTF